MYPLNERLYDIIISDPHWIPPFRFEIESIFNEDTNPFFAHGECERFLIQDGDDVVARFALMNNREKDQVYDPPMGGLEIGRASCRERLTNCVVCRGRT